MKHIQTFESFLNEETINEANVNTLLNKAQTDKKKVPNLIISNGWQYSFGKFGSTNATFVTVKKTGNESDWFNNVVNGYETHGYKLSEPKTMNELPDWNVLAVMARYEKFGDGTNYKEIRLRDLPNYLSDTENETINIYKL